MLTPSSAVTTTLIVLLPTGSAMADEALPRATTLPFTRTEAAVLAASGVSVTLSVAWVTAAL
ncbi:MAG: hypothetical protein QM722_21025 [Piscinibacter sp.]